MTCQPISASFPDLQGKYERLSPLLIRYSKHDLIVASFCISSWSRNRSAQSTILALNAVIRDAHSEGEAISTYDEFRSFCRTVTDECPISFYDDYTYPCFGEETLFYKGSYYRLILGCGAEQEYAALPFLVKLAQKADRENELLQLLEYLDSTVRALAPSNAPYSGSNERLIETPPPRYWAAVKDFFEEGRHHLPGPEIINQFADKPALIEKQHFVACNGKTLPLFNPSLLLDYEERLVEQLERSQNDIHEAVNATLVKLAIEIHWPRYSYEQRVFPYPTITADGMELPLPATFALTQDNHTLVFLEDGVITEADISNTTLRLSNAAKATIASIRNDADGPKRFSLVVEKPSEVQFVIHNHHCCPMRADFLARESVNHLPRCSALDLCSMLNFADSIEQLYRFFHDHEQDSRHRSASYSGIAGIFIDWIENDEQALLGAEDQGGQPIIIYGPGNVDAYYLESFTWRFANIPFDNAHFGIGNPFAWRVNTHDHGFAEIEPKTPIGARALIKLLKPESKAACIMLSTHVGYHIELNEAEINNDALTNHAVEDMIMLMCNDLEDELASFIIDAGGIAQLEFVSEEWALKQGGFQRAENSPYAIRINDKSPYAFTWYTAFRDELLEELPNHSDRRLETDLMELIVECVGRKFKVETEALQRSIRALGDGPKKVDSAPIAIPYHFRSPAHVAIPQTVKTKIDKQIAYLCEAANLQPGDYSGKPANRVVRKMQQALMPQFVEMLKQFDAMSVHEAAARYCACLEHEAFVHKKRATAFADIDPIEARRVSSDAARMRHDAREDIQAARFLIESNLVYSDCRSERNCDQKSLQQLLAYADRLTELSTSADIFYFEPDYLTLVIEDNYVIRLEQDDALKEASHALSLRQLQDEGHILDDQTVDIEMAKRATVAFEKDTGVSFDCLISVCDCLAKLIYERNDSSYVNSHVIRIPLEATIACIVEEFGDYYSEAQVRNALDYLTIDPTDIMSDEGIALDYVPIGRVKGRPNRYEMKPVVRDGNSIVFAEVSLGLLRERWMTGIIQRFLPYKYTLDETYAVIEQWKRTYEKALERDVRQAFLDAELPSSNIYSDLYLHKHGQHPDDLGDYDGLAFDPSTNVLWAIECKELEKHETAFDAMSFQQRFFGSKNQEGKLAKFERRITYLQSNVDTILKDLGVGDAVRPTIRAVVVSNKPFIDNTLRAPYEILSFSEFRNELFSSNS